MPRQYKEVAASAARTATWNSGDIDIPDDCQGCRVVIDITAQGAAPATTFTIQAKDPSSGKYYTLLASAALTAVGTTVLKVYPGAVAVANLVANDVISNVIRILASHANGDSHTYSVALETF